MSASVTCTLGIAEITGNLSKRRFQNIEKASAFPNMSASVTCTLSFAQITGNLSKISGEVDVKFTVQSSIGCRQE
ncbi:hypothetical protein ACFX15_012503 [Malus domestica]